MSQGRRAGGAGTGKTLIGRAIASNMRATFFNISASSLTSKWCAAASTPTSAQTLTPHRPLCKTGTGNGNDVSPRHSTLPAQASAGSFTALVYFFHAFRPDAQSQSFQPRTSSSVKLTACQQRGETPSVFQAPPPPPLLFFRTAQIPRDGSASAGMAAACMRNLFLQRSPTVRRVCGAVTTAYIARPAATLGTTVLSLVTADQGIFPQRASSIACGATLFSSRKPVIKI